MRLVLATCLLISCAPATVEPALGIVIPKTVNYLPGNGTMTAVVQFSDDIRNDCTASDQHMNYGNLALLSVFGSADFAKGQVVPWMTKGQSQGAPAPAAFFSIDGLSGLDLTAADGGVTLVDVPANTPDKSYKLHLVASDNRLDATFSVPPLCP